MKNSRNIKTVDLIEALRRCATPGVHCDGCVFCSDEDHEEPWCGDVLLQEAVRRLEEYTDRCARYAEEIAVLKAAGECVEWIPVTERLPDGECLAVSMLKYQPSYKEMLVGYVAKDARYETGYCCECDGVILPNVTHWTEKPYPAEGGE